MTSDPSDKGKNKAPPSQSELAQRFLDLWQDQMVAMSRDQDLIDMLTRWTSPGRASSGPAGPVADAFWSGMTKRYDSPERGDGASDDGNQRAQRPDDGDSGVSSRPASPSGLSRDSSDDVDELRRRLRELEERIAALEGGAEGGSGATAGGSGGTARQPDRKQGGGANIKPRQT